MDTITLVSQYIDEGARLLNELPGGGFDVTGAFWILAADNGEWYFYVVSPLVETQGLAKAYGQLHTASRRLGLQWIDPLGMKLIGPNNPIARDAMAILQRAGGPGNGPIRWEGRHLGNVSIESAYLYALPANNP